MANETFQKPAEAEARAIIESLKEAVGATILEIDRSVDKKIDLMMVPKGQQMVSVKAFLDEYRDAPERIIGTSTLFDVDSFVAYVNRHKTTSSACFLDPSRSAPGVVAVIDYHGEKEGPDATAEPHFCQHRAKYAFPLSDEWKAWSAVNAKPLAQENFAAFLEDHVMDVLDPQNTDPETQAFANKLGMKFADGSTLVSLSRGLTIYAGFNMTKLVNLQTGEATMNFVEEHKDAQGAPLKIPGAFAIAIPVFRDGPNLQLAVRLRYRVSSGKVSWAFELYKPESVFDLAIDSAREEIADETKLDVFTGTPEQ